MGLIQENPVALPQNPLEYIFLLIVFGPILEEFIYRGIIQERLSWYFSERAAILFTSFLFALIHWTPGDITVFVGASVFRFIRSCFYGVIYAKTRNIVHSSVAHSAVNLYGPILTILFP
ncbi:MAG: CPBP family intramembrane metalloprotease [Candidatus Thorarchaeota archaeon]|nr:CPBP family intramembrane metalloprotease [Candidatus Thorarchaeota archaeon]